MSLQSPEHYKNAEKAFASLFSDDDGDVASRASDELSSSGLSKEAGGSGQLVPNQMIQTEQSQSIFPTPEPTLHTTSNDSEEGPSTSTQTAPESEIRPIHLLQQKQAQMLAQPPPFNTRVLMHPKKRGPGRPKQVEVPESAAAPTPALTKSGQPRKKRETRKSLLNYEEPSDWQKLLKRKSLETELLAEEHNRTADDHLDLTLATKGTIQLVEWMRFHRIYFAGGLHVRSKLLDRSGQRHVTYVMNAADDIDDLPDTTDIEVLKEREKKPEIIKKLLERQVLPPRRACQYTRYVVLECNGTHWRLIDWYVIKATKDAEPEEEAEPKPKRKYTRKSKGSDVETLVKSPLVPRTQRPPRAKTPVTTGRKRRSADMPLPNYSEDSDDLNNYDKSSGSESLVSARHLLGAHRNVRNSAPSSLPRFDYHKGATAVAGSSSSRNQRATPDATFNHFEFREPEQSFMSVNNNGVRTLIPQPGPYNQRGINVSTTANRNRNMPQPPSRVTSPVRLPIRPIPLHQQDRLPPPRPNPPVRPHLVSNSRAVIRSPTENQQRPVVSTSFPGVTTVTWSDKEIHFPTPKAVELEMEEDEPVLKVTFRSLSGQFAYLSPAETTRTYSLNHRDDQYCLLAVDLLPKEGIQLPGGNGVFLQREVITEVLTEARNKKRRLMFNLSRLGNEFNSSLHCRIHASHQLPHHVIVGPFPGRCNIRLPFMIPLKATGPVHESPKSSTHQQAPAAVNKDPRSSGRGSRWMPHDDVTDVKPELPLIAKRFQLARATRADGTLAFNLFYEDVIRVRLPGKDKVFIGSMLEFNAMIDAETRYVSGPLQYSDRPEDMVVDLTGDDDDHLDPHNNNVQEQEEQMEPIMLNESEPKATTILLGHIDGIPIKGEKWFRVEDPLVDGHFKYFFSAELAKQWACEYINDFSKRQFTPAAASSIQRH